MIKLTGLDPRWQKYIEGIAPDYHGRKLPDGSTQWGGFPCEEVHQVDTLAEAQGIRFYCPICYVKNNGPQGTHIVAVSFEGRGVLPHQGSHGKNGPSRWVVAGGTGFDDLQLTPSILLGGGCNWHGFVGSSGAPPGYVITI